MDETSESWSIGTSTASCNDDDSDVSEAVFSRRHESRQKFSSAFGSVLIKLTVLNVLIPLDVRLIDEDKDEHDGWQTDSGHCDITETERNMLEVIKMYKIRMHRKQSHYYHDLSGLFQINYFKFH